MGSASTREKFLISAIHLVAQDGMENLRTKDIASAAGYTEVTMYRYFQSKEEILREAFYMADEHVSAILSKSKHLSRFKGDQNLESVKDLVHMIWLDVFHYLLKNREEALFLVRYRYSAYYNSEVRSHRRAYTGDFDRFYGILEEYFGKHDFLYQGFMVNWIFEMTLCFAEKIISGRMKNDKQMEGRLWAAISGAAENLLIAPN